jgi:voltage-dependent calcium channel
LILFEIVSLEGWIDAMGIATSATGQNSQPETNSSESNSIFFLDVKRHKTAQAHPTAKS